MRTMSRSISILYGKSNWQANYGSISGRVAFANDSAGVTLASVVAIASNGPAVSTLTNPDGTVPHRWSAAEL